ncbi:fibronectin-binding autotransporter adhesin [Silvimonas terrae]|uniref:Fibronectin-binding autotransporter adhesin n=1 Tax=Silvimonas terrae TaxID=300266 RepID=A0A840RDH0_9NEIS|nr:autotransporter outer membrane beta-barrel domain-containing protein [Silvimonas terrae]MBB5190410.1 fibronectin-binding autotransporter adhesin [Silvimonas terrae]
MLFPLSASAAVYTVSSEAQLRDAITTINSTSDANAVIKLAASFTVSGTVSFSAATQPITLDTQGFVLSKATTSTIGRFTTNTNGVWTFNGNYTGLAGTTPAMGLSLAAVGFQGVNITNGTIRGGDQSGATGAGGVGVTLVSGAPLTNNGSIKGGTSVNFDTTSSTLGAGVSMVTATSLVNSSTGVILGGDGSGGGVAGAGVSVFSGATVRIVNNGMIRGGTALDANTIGGNAIRIGGGTVTLTNTGTLEGGRGAAAFSALSSSTINMVNSGTVIAGAGYANAIEFGATATSVATLELQAGSNIIGNVIASQSGTNDTFKLGGSTNSVFDASTLGDTAQYRYFDTFIKTGTSTWVLIGTDALTLPWTVDQGTLQIGNGGTDGSMASDVTVNSGASLAFNRADTYTYGGTISGAGGVSQVGMGTTVLTAANTYTGTTNINAGTLQVDGSITSPVSVNAGGTLSGSGVVTGTVTNSGIVMPGSNGAGVLTLANYIGNSGTVRIATRLGGDSATTGLLDITGDTAGSSFVKVVNVGGTGVQTVDGIKIIEVAGVSNGSFTLVGDYLYKGTPAVVAGAYAYRLYKGGVSTPADGDWYLRSTLDESDLTSTPSTSTPAATQPLYAPTVPLYEAYSRLLQTLNELGTLQERVGNRSWSVDATHEGGISRGAWAQIDGQHAHDDPHSSTAAMSQNIRTWKFQAGIDAPVYESNAGSLVAGATFQYGTANSDVRSDFGTGTVDAKGYGFGGTLTWYGNNGFYLDSQATITWFDTDLNSTALARRVADGNGGRGYAASLEAGQRLPLENGWSLTPQVQLAWSQAGFDSFTDPYDAQVSADNGSSLVNRVGLSLDHEQKWIAANGKASRSHLYGVANVYYDYLNGTSAHVSDVTVENKLQAWWAGVGMGASLNWDDDRYTAYGEVLARMSLQDVGDSNALGARVGIKMKW